MREEVSAHPAADRCRGGAGREGGAGPKGRKGCKASRRALGLPFVQMKHGRS